MQEHAGVDAHPSSGRGALDKRDGTFKLNLTDLSSSKMHANAMNVYASDQRFKKTGVPDSNLAEKMSPVKGGINPKVVVTEILKNLKNKGSVTSKNPNASMIVRNYDPTGEM